jgi:hypothetical protein
MVEAADGNTPSAWAALFLPGDFIVDARDSNEPNTWMGLLFSGGFHRWSQGWQ